MSQFTSPLQLEYMDGRQWKLIRDFEYHVGTYPSERIITAPPGFITNFASIPRVFWTILPPTGKYGKAAVIHDLLYSVHALCKDREEADQIFLEAMRVLGVPNFKACIMYQAVRTFGQSAWEGK